MRLLGKIPTVANEVAREPLSTMRLLGRVLTVDNEVVREPLCLERVDHPDDVGSVMLRP